MGVERNPGSGSPLCASALLLMGVIPQFNGVSMRSEKSKQQQRDWQREYQRRWREANPGRNAAVTKAWRQRRLALAVVHGARQRAKLLNTEFKLTKAWADEMWTGLCAVTGLKFVSTHPTTPLSPSLDRIDNSKGYIPGNCRFVCLGYNMLKGTGSDALAIKIAKRIIRRRTRSRK